MDLLSFTTSLLKSWVIGEVMWAWWIDGLITVYLTFFIEIYGWCTGEEGFEGIGLRGSKMKLFNGFRFDRKIVIKICKVLKLNSVKISWQYFCGLHLKVSLIKVLLSLWKIFFRKHSKMIICPIADWKTWKNLWFWWLHLLWMVRGFFNDIQQVDHGEIWGKNYLSRRNCLTIVGYRFSHILLTPSNYLRILFTF